jgi:hypothetical protein
MMMPEVMLILNPITKTAQIEVIHSSHTNERASRNYHAEVRRTLAANGTALQGENET